MAKAKAAPTIDDRFAPVVKALQRSAGVTLEPGWGKGNHVLKVNAKIFAMINSSGFVVKLPKARVDAIVAEGGTRFDPRKNGKVMKEWLVAPSDADWVGLAREAYRFVKK